MKSLIHKVVYLLVTVVRFVLPYSRLQSIRRIKTNIYSMWISSEFRTYGERSIVQYPLLLRGGKYINIGKGVGIGKRVTLSAWDAYRDGSVFNPEIIIGDNTSIGDDCHITAINQIKIGCNVLMGQKILISDNSHGQTDPSSLETSPIERPLFSKGAVIIEDGVWIGDKVTILADVKIGKNSIVGANALVSKDVPPNCVVGGNPARIIKRISLGE